MTSQPGKRRKKQEGEPKQPSNKYMLYCTDTRDAVAAELLPDPVTAKPVRRSPKEVTAEQARRWKALDKSEAGRAVKAQYVDTYQRNLVKYNAEMDAWKAAQVV